MSDATIVIPMPPSVNDLWTVVVRQRRRQRRATAFLVKSKLYKAWLRIAVPVMKFSLPKFSAPVHVTITIRGGDGWNPRRDIDNCAKATLDGLIAATRIPDDSCSHVLRCESTYLLPLSGKPSCCWITVREVTYQDHTIDEEEPPGE